MRKSRLMFAAVAAVALSVALPVTASADSNHKSEKSHHAAKDHKNDHGKDHHGKGHHGNDHGRNHEDRGRRTFDVFHQYGQPVPHDPAASGNSNTTARSELIRVGGYVLAIVRVKGSAPNLPHAQHIHGVGMNKCPRASADIDTDGLINTSEGAPDYGPIVVSLTTTGDTSPASGLAVARFPVADANGNYTYVRLLTVGTDISANVAVNLDDFHIVQHGIDTNHNGMYDFSKGASDLDPSLPQEATVPAACGLIH